jgi:hypothetical protein
MEVLAQLPGDGQQRESAIAQTVLHDHGGAGAMVGCKLQHVKANAVTDDPVYLLLTWCVRVMWCCHPYLLLYVAANSG